MDVSGGGVQTDMRPSSTGAANNNNSGSATSTTTLPDHTAICRDFLRNACHRGRRCKFPHPPRADSTTTAAAAAVQLSPPTPASSSGGGGGGEAVSFCHDYQNGQCNRSTCRFLHCSAVDERVYRQTGQLPAAALLGAVARGAEFRLAQQQAPLCKDFARGECARAAKCKYLHLTVEELRTYLSQQQQQPGAGGAAVVAVVGTARNNTVTAADTTYTITDEPSAKRRHILVPGLTFDQMGGGGGAYSTGSSALAAGATVSLVEYQIMENDNRILCRQLQELKKQVDDLKTTNEFLLDQNAQLRFAKQQSEQPLSAAAAGATARVATVSVPAVTLSTSCVPAAAGSIAMAPLSQPLAPGQTAQVVTVPGSMTAVPVSLARSQQGTAATAVAVSLQAPVSMQQQPVTLTSMSSIQSGDHQPAIQVTPLSTIQAAQSSLPSIQVATIQSSIQPTQPSIQMNGPVACSISGAPVVSYPIVSQQLRPLHPSDLPGQ